MILPDNGFFVSSTEFETICPECGEQTFYYNPYKKKGHCKRKNNCGVIVNNYKEYLKLFDLEGDLDDDWEGLAPRQKTNRLEMGFGLTGTVPAWTHPLAQGRLRSRGLDEKIVDKAGLLYSHKTFRLVCPISSHSPAYQPRQLMRRVDGKGKWIPTHAGIDTLEYFYGLDHLVPGLRRVILFEGIFDVLSTRMLGVGLAMLGAKLTLSKQLWLMRTFREVVWWPDPDKAGDDVMRANTKALQSMGLLVHKVEGPDDEDGNPTRPPDAGRDIRPRKHLEQAVALRNLRRWCLTGARRNAKVC